MRARMKADLENCRAQETELRSRKAKIETRLGEVEAQIIATVGAGQYILKVLAETEEKTNGPDNGAEGGAIPDSGNADVCHGPHTD